VERRNKSRFLGVSFWIKLKIFGGSTSIGEVEPPGLKILFAKTAPMAWFLLYVRQNITLCA